MTQPVWREHIQSQLLISAQRVILNVHNVLGLQLLTVLNVDQVVVQIITYMHKQILVWRIAQLEKSELLVLPNYVRIALILAKLAQEHLLLVLLAHPAHFLNHNNALLRVYH